MICLPGCVSSAWAARPVGWRSVPVWGRCAAGRRAAGCALDPAAICTALGTRRCPAESTHTGINSLAPGKLEWHFRYLISQTISVIDGWGISCEIALRRMSLDLTDDKSTLVQVMAWCRQAPNHYLSQCWPRSMSPYGVIRPQWVKRKWHTFCRCYVRIKWTEI